MTEEEIKAKMQEGFDKIQPKVAEMTSIIMDAYQEGFNTCFELLTGQKGQMIMDYKEKYEQALERAKVINPGTVDYEVAVKIFPELKESEDEKIRKSILELVKQSSHILNPMNQKSMLAWLKKQGELKPIFRVGDYIRNKKTKDRVLIEQIDIANKIYCYVSRDDAAEIHSDFRFSEQNDWEIIGQKIVGQKPTEWSEEDEKECKRVVGLLEGWLSTFNETYYAEDCKCGISWLKSLKQRMKGE